MPSNTVTVGSAIGLHARPAALIAQAATELGVPVTLSTDGEEPVDAGSALMIMTLGAGHGDQVTSRATTRPPSPASPSWWRRTSTPDTPPERPRPRCPPDAGPRCVRSRSGLSEARWDGRRAWRRPRPAGRSPGRHPPLRTVR